MLIKTVILIFFLLSLFLCGTAKDSNTTDISKSEQKEKKESTKRIDLFQDSITINNISTLTAAHLTDEKILKSVLTLLSEGNKDALILQFKSRGYLRSNPYVGELLDIATGKVININPKMFLSVLRNYWEGPNQNDISLLHILCALDDDYVDEFEKQIIETDKRIQSLKKVEDKDLIPIRDECVQVLNQNKKTLNLMLKEN